MINIKFTIALLAIAPGISERFCHFLQNKLMVNVPKTAETMR